MGTIVFIYIIFFDPTYTIGIEEYNLALKAKPEFKKKKLATNTH